MYRIINHKAIQEYFERVAEWFEQDGSVFLIGETTQVIEGCREWTTGIDFYSSVRSSDRKAFNDAVLKVAREMDIPVSDEFPGDLIPLPDGYEERTRALSNTSWTRSLRLDVSHFDPYAACYRCIARGDEPDYQVVLTYLESGWVTEEGLATHLALLLPKFNYKTIQQDPAEFRRKYAGVIQMWRSRKQTQAPRQSRGL